MINYSIGVLVVTNIWIFIYRYLLNIFNLIFPPKLDSTFLLPTVAPEPFEIPLYLLLTFTMTLLLYIFYKRTPLKLSFSLWQRRIILVFLGLLFLLQLGDYPLNQNTEVPAYITPFMKNLSIAVFAGYVLLIMSVFIVISKLFSFLKKRENGSIWFYVFIIFIIALITYQPGFPISWHDYAYLFGPIVEIANGKTIFNQVSSKYGFLSVLILAQLLKIGVFKLSYLPFLIYLGYIGQYFLCFYLVFKISRSIKLSSLCLFSIITLNFYSLGHLPMSVPQAGPLRWLPMVLVIYIVYKFKKINSKISILLIALLSFITIDSGVSIILAYFFSIFLFILNGSLSLRQSVLSVLSLFLSILLLFLFTNITLLIDGYQQINLGMIFTKLIQYSQGGFGMIKMPELTYFWLVMLVYFTSIVYWLKRGPGDKNSQTLLIIINLSLFGAVYFVGRSHPHNLFNISLLFLLNLSILLSFIYRSQKQKIKMLILITLFFIFVFIPAYNRRLALSYIGYQKLNRLGIKLFEDRFPDIFIYHFCKPQDIHFIRSEMDECLRLKYASEVEFIKQNIEDKEIVIISPDDTYLIYLTGKKNMLYANPQSDILTKADLDLAINKAIRLCPKKIVVDPRIFNQPFKQGTLNFIYTVQPELFNQLRSKCGLEYDLFRCTDNICIAKAV